MENLIEWFEYRMLVSPRRIVVNAWQQLIALRLTRLLLRRKLSPIHLLSIFISPEVAGEPSAISILLFSRPLALPC